MLDLARIEGHAIQLDPGDVGLRDLVDAAVERLHRNSPDRPVAVDLDGALEVVADWGRLGQVLDNLLGNADVYAPTGTPIRIEAARGKRSMVVVRVIDRGPGIPPEQRERVFERFVRFGDGAAGHGGTGLGLAIVRGLVEAHAGRVWVEEPHEGEGTRLAFALPAAAPEPSAVAGEDVDVDVDEQPDQPAHGA
jgi:signal transduction histidine kinase